LRVAALALQIVWAKQHFTLGRGDYHWKHETCWYAVREGRAAIGAVTAPRLRLGVPQQHTLSATRSATQSWGHGHSEAGRMQRRPIVNNSRPGQAIYDPFLGSGTSLIAAEMTGRVCYGVELSPAYNRCRRATLAGFHRARRDAARLRSILRRARPKARARSIRIRSWLEEHSP